MSVLRTITNFRSQLTGGGARPNLFEVEIPSFPALAGTALVNDGWRTGAAQEATKFRFLCKSAAMPASNVTPVEVPFRGRILKVAGERTFDTWTVTVINDEDFMIRTAFERWMNAISKLDNATGAANPNSYVADARVYQLARGGGTFNSTNHQVQAAADDQPGIAPLRTYIMEGIWPSNISQIDLSYDTTDTIEEFTVEFQVLWWRTGKGEDPRHTGTDIAIR